MKNRRLTFLLAGVAAVLILGLGGATQFARAEYIWSPPEKPFPDGNVFPPIDTSSGPQEKKGALTIGQTLSLGSYEALKLVKGGYISVSGNNNRFMLSDHYDRAQLTSLKDLMLYSTGGSVLVNSKLNLRLNTDASIVMGAKWGVDMRNVRGVGLLLPSGNVESSDFEGGSGAVVFDTKDKVIKFFDGSSWKAVGAGTGGGIVVGTGAGWLAETGKVYTATSTDNVGIGTTSPKEKLQIGDRFTFHDGGWKNIGYNLYYDGGAGKDKRILNDVVANIGFTNTGDISFRTSQSGGANSEISWTQGMIIKNDGNIGIGTTSPKEKLQIGDRFTFHDGGWKNIGYNLYYDGGAGKDKRILNDVVANIGFTNTGDISFRTSQSGDANSEISWTRGMIIKNDGNVGIGTDAPKYKLDIGVEGAKLGIGLTSYGNPRLLLSDEGDKATIQSYNSSLKINQSGNSVFFGGDRPVDVDIVGSLTISQKILSETGTKYSYARTGEWKDDESKKKTWVFSKQSQISLSEWPEDKRNARMMCDTKHTDNTEECINSPYPASDSDPQYKYDLYVEITLGTNVTSIEGCTNTDGNTVCKYIPAARIFERYENALTGGNLFAGRAAFGSSFDSNYQVTVVGSSFGSTPPGFGGIKSKGYLTPALFLETGAPLGAINPGYALWVDSGNIVFKNLPCRSGQFLTTRSDGVLECKTVTASGGIGNVVESGPFFVFETPNSQNNTNLLGYFSFCALSQIDKNKAGGAQCWVFQESGKWKINYGKSNSDGTIACRVQCFGGEKTWKATTGMGNFNETCNEWLVRTNQRGSEYPRARAEDGVIADNRCLYGYVDNKYLPKWEVPDYRNSNYRPMSVYETTIAGTTPLKELTEVYK